MAMENGPFTDDFPSYKPPFMVGIFHGYVSHIQRVAALKVVPKAEPQWPSPYRPKKRPPKRPRPTAWDDRHWPPSFQPLQIRGLMDGTINSHRTSHKFHRLLIWLVVLTCFNMLENHLEKYEFVNGFRMTSHIFMKWKIRKMFHKKDFPIYYDIFILWKITAMFQTTTRFQ